MPRQDMLMQLSAAPTTHQWIAQRGVGVLVGHGLECHAEKLVHIPQHLDRERRQLAHAHFGHVLRAEHLRNSEDFSAAA